MALTTKLVKASTKDFKCLLCTNTIHKGNPYVYNVNSEGGHAVTNRICIECSYLLYFTDKCIQEGNFSDTRIPNFLRKIRTEYRKNPKEAWDKLTMQQKGEQ